MKIGYYPGCSLEGTARDFDESVRAVLGALGVELVEVPDWSCCGASPAHMLSEELALALPLRNLLIAEAGGLKDVLAPCPACYAACRHAHLECLENPDAKARMEAISEQSYGGSVEMVSLLTFLADRMGEDAVRAKVVRELAGLKLAPYYGCMLRLPGSDIDDVESPRMFERILSWLGADPVGWAYRTECCGASLAMPETGVVEELVGRIVESARASGAQAIVTACPLCQANLEMRQGGASAGVGLMPVLYLTQVVGIAFGLDEKSLGLHRLLTDWRDAFGGVGQRSIEPEQAG